MKKNFVRFMGLIIAMLMVVTMIPVTAFAEETASAAFAVGDSTYYLMPDVTTTYNGKTYIGIYANVQEITYADNQFPDDQNTQERIVLVSDGDRAEGGKYVVVNNSYTTPVDIQTKITYFEPFGKYIVGADYEWFMGEIYTKPDDAARTKYYFKGSVGLPSSSELQALYANDIAVSHGAGLATRAASYLGVPGGAFWQRVRSSNVENVLLARKYVDDDSTKDVEKFVSLQGSAWGYMTYVSPEFFVKTKLDVSSMGSLVKEYLAANYIQDDFAGLGYTADEFASMGISEVPANPTPAHSPNYLKVIAEDGVIKEYLYNDTIVKNGKTYVGLIGTTDMYNNGLGYIGANFRPLMSEGVDFEGEALPTDSNWYLSTNITTEWNNNKYKEIHTFMNYVPTAMQEYLLKYSYDCGQNNMYDGFTAHTLRTIGKLTIVSKDELAAHINYLEPAATHDSQIVTRTGNNAYGFYVYDKAEDVFKVIGTYEYPGGSLFARMYVDADMFKSVKLDVASMRSNVKALLKANFLRSELEGLYTDEELDVIGVESFRVEEKPEGVTGSSFVVDGKTFYYLEDTIIYNGKKYFRVFDKRDYTPWSGDAFYQITERAEGGIYIVLHQASLTGTTLENHPTNFGVFGDYVIPSDYEWSYGTAAYKGANVPVYFKGSVNVPTPADYDNVINQGISFTNQGQMRITSTFFVWSNGTSRYNYTGNQKGNGLLTYVEDGNYFKGVYSAGYNYVSYISEDFFIENELDIATTSDMVLDLIKNNFTREELAAGGWSESALDKLFDSNYSGTGLGLVAYKTGPAEVAVVINNNNPVASTGSKAIVVAAYSKAGLEKAAVIPVSGTIPANAYTSKLTASLNVADNVEITEIKVMLWDSIENMKPLADIVCVN